MDDIGRVLRAVAGLQNMRFSNAAAITIYCYNILLTLDLEVEYIWSRFSFSLPTLFYITNRYISLGFFLILTYNTAGHHGLFSDDYCRLPIKFVGFLLSYTAWTGILTLRVCAIWRQRRYLVKAIQVLWVCLLCANVAIGYLAYREGEAFTSYNPLARLCTTSSTLRISKLTPIPPMIYELFLTILTIIKAFDFVVYPSRSSLPLLYRVLARDGITYFLITTTINVVNLIAWYSLPDTELDLICGVFWAITSTLMAKMMLNLRDAHEQSVLQQLGTDGVDGRFSFGSPDQSTFMGASFVVALQDPARVPVTKVESGSDSSKSQRPQDMPPE